MNRAFVRTLSLVVATSTMLLAACGPSDIVGKEKLEPVVEGMKLSELGSALGAGPLTPNQPADSLRLFNGYRTQIFLAAGKQYRVVWYRAEPGSIEDEIVRERETPILLADDAVIGKGWAFFDETATEVGLPNPYRSKARLDSLAKGQLKTP